MPDPTTSFTIPSCVPSRAPFSLSSGVTMFNGTPDPRIAWGYNTDFEGNKVLPNEPQLLWGIEADYNNGHSHGIECYLHYTSSDGKTQFRPLAFSIDRETHEVGWVSLRWKAMWCDINGRYTACLDNDKGYLKLFPPTDVSKAYHPVERLDIEDGNIYCHSTYHGSGKTPSSQRVFFETWNSDNFRVAGAGMQVDYTRISDTDYSSGLSFWTSGDNVPHKAMTLSERGNVEVTGAIRASGFATTDKNKPVVGATEDVKIGDTTLHFVNGLYVGHDKT